MEEKRCGGQHGRLHKEPGLGYSNGELKVGIRAGVSGAGRLLLAGKTELTTNFKPP